MLTKVHFTLPANYVAGATEGFLLGEFNKWNPEEAVALQKNEDGSMIAEIKLETGKSYQYRYLLNDGRWVNDGTNTILLHEQGNTIEEWKSRVWIARSFVLTSSTQEIMIKMFTYMMVNTGTYGEQIAAMLISDRINNNNRASKT